MKTITVYGSSDDLIEVDGAIREEFNYYSPDTDDHANYLAFSDGTILSVLYAKDGCWRINRVASGDAQYTKTEAEGADTDNYTDKVNLVGDMKWVVFGSQLVRAK